MTAITLDPLIRAKFDGVTECVNIYDDTGRLLGFFVPSDDAARGSLEVPFTREQLDRFKVSGSGCSLTEVWRRLGGAMSYTVIWLRAAQDLLTELWMQSDDRRAVTEAANRIDAVLRLAPYSHSESREGDERLMMIRPLGVLYVVSDADRQVTVFAVWHIDGSDG